MSKQYLGLVVGGPADGHRIVNNTPRLVVEEKPAMPPIGAALRIGTLGLDQPLPRRHIYHWTDAGDIALWLPDNWSLEAAKSHMAAAIGVAGLADTYEQLRIAQRDNPSHG